jgi:hypothetical protein
VIGQVGDALAIPALRRRRGQESGPLRGVIDDAIEAIETRMREAAQASPGGGGAGSALPLPPT